MCGVAPNESSRVILSGSVTVSFTLGMGSDRANGNTTKYGLLRSSGPRESLRHETAMRRRSHDSIHIAGIFSFVTAHRVITRSMWLPETWKLLSFDVPWLHVT